MANLDPKMLAMELKCGIAPAMKANIKGPFWGRRGEHFANEKQARLCGEWPKVRVPGRIMDIVADLNKADEKCPARQLVQGIG